MVDGMSGLAGVFTQTELTDTYRHTDNIQLYVNTVTHAREQAYNRNAEYIMNAWNKKYRKTSFFAQSWWLDCIPDFTPHKDIFLSYTVMLSGSALWYVCGLYWRWIQGVDQHCPQRCMGAHIQSALFSVRCFMVVDNKMLASLLDLLLNLPYLTTTLEGWEMARAKQLYLTVFSQQESYSSWLIQPLNFNLSPWPRIPSPQSDTLGPARIASWGLGMTFCVSNDLAPSLCGERCSVEWARLPTDRALGCSRGRLTGLI